MTEKLRRVTDKELELQEVNDIVVAGDPGCTGFDDESRAVLSDILKRKCDIFIIAGDLAQFGTSDELTDIAGFLNGNASAPVFVFCGNHDLPDYEKVFGFSSYALVCGEFVLAMLNNSNARFSPGDIQFLENEFKKYPLKKFLIFFHIPPPLSFDSSAISETEWSRLRAVLDKYKERVEAIVCAHIHGYHEYFKDGYRVIITAGGGGKMIYDLPDDKCRIYHSLKISLKKGAHPAINFTPVNSATVKKGAL